MRFPSPSTRRGKLLGQLLTSLLVLSLAAGCRSTQTVYRVVPATGAAVAPRPATGAANEPNAPSAAPVAAQPPVRVLPRVAAPRRWRVVATAPSPAVARTAMQKLESNPRLLRAATRVVHRTATVPRNTAESGLGTTFLGILGILAIPVGLIGLLLSGGALAWGIVALVGGLLLLNAIFEPFAD